MGVVKITRVSGPPSPRTKYSPVYDEMRSAGIGNWIKVQFDSPDEASSSRAAIGHGLRKMGIEYQFAVRGADLYIKKLPSGSD